MTFPERIYSRSPVWLQHALVSAYGWKWRQLRLRADWPRYTREFQDRDGWRRDQWRAYSTRRMREVLRTSLDRVPHYREAWRRHGVTMASIDRMEIEDLPTIPILSKDMVRRAPQSLLVDGTAPKGAYVFHTSGSTGTPIATYWTSADLQRSLALREARSAGWAGVSYRDPRATFSGRLAVPDPNSKGPFHRYNLFERQVYFSPFHLSPSTVGQYIDALRRYRPVWLTGYAYSYYTLARLALEQGLAIPSPKSIVTTSEKVTQSMREVMERGYGCKVYEEYGTVEDVMYACECEHGGLHVNPDAGIVEIVNDAGKPAAPGETGRVVATGFIRESQLFVRFELGDEAAWSDASCPCGRDMPLLQEITGRIEDAVIGPDGRRMVRFHGIFVEQPNVLEGQIVQETQHDILVNIVATDAFSDADVDDIRRRIHTRLTSAVRVRVERVPSIPRTKAGKYQAVVSRMAKPPGVEAD